MSNIAQGPGWYQASDGLWYPPAPPQVVTRVALKSVGISYAFWLFLGFLGVHQFYLGKIGRGLLYLFTVGGFGIGLIIDLFTLPAQVKTVNAQIRTGVR